MQRYRVIKYISLIVVLVFKASALKAEINNQTLAVLVNINDPQSIEIAEYYKQARLIPDSNIIYLKFKPASDSLTVDEFKKIESELNKKVGANIQAYALAWRKPWRVSCMSITSAFSLGINPEYCATDCKVTKPVKYFNSKSHQPFTDFKIRPSMLLSSNTLEGVKKLIDRGVAADYSRPNGTAYLLSTSDKHRNVRAAYYSEMNNNLQKILNIELLNADAIKNKNDILFYFTGLKSIKWLDENDFLPGAIADHLTSGGGQLFHGAQMSVLSWIDAGVTGSYGAVVEPCNFVQKFPDPRVVIQKYLSNNSLIEAYWKSVRMPGQGLFVGEPLASPFKGCNLVFNKQGMFEFYKNKIVNLVERKSRNCI